VAQSVAGIALVALGLGGLWAMGAYVQRRTTVRTFMRFKMRHAGRWRWWHSLMLPVVHPRADVVLAYVASVAAIAGGVLLLL
jgi:hypothetical protein